MKKMFLILAVVVIFSFTANSQEQIGSYDNLPEQAKTTLSQHFSKDAISYVMIDKEGSGLKYEVHFVDNTEVEFGKKGNLLKVDCKKYPVPDVLVPEQVRSYVKAKFPSAFITEWSKDDRKWKAELNNGLDLVFDKKYNFLRVDD